MGYGAQEATFQNLQGFAPEQNTVDCYDARHSGETCNGCLGIIKSSFAADYTDSTFTFTGNKFYQVKSTEVHGRLVYDLTNPEPAGRPQVCNHEWSKGGLTINENDGVVEVGDDGVVEVGHDAQSWGLLVLWCPRFYI